MLDVAEQLIADGLGIAKQRRIQDVITLGLWNMANIHTSRGHFDKARECLQEGLLTCREIGHLSIRVGILITYGVVVSSGAQPDIRLALEYWCEGLNCAEMTGQHEQETLLLCNLAEGHLYLEKPEVAHSYIARAISLAVKLGSDWEVGSAYMLLGHYYLKTAQPTRAKRAYKKALKRGEHAKYPEIIADAHFGLGKCDWFFGRKLDGMRLIYQALSEHLQAQNGRAEEIVEWMRQNDVTCPD